MINFNNHNITEIHYDGHRIQRVIGCDGRVVWKYNKGGYENQYLTIIPKEDTDLVLSGMLGTPCYYSFDSGTTWVEMQKDTPINVLAGQKVMFKKNHYKSTIGNISFPTGTFILSSDYDVEGNVMSMAYGDDFYDKTDLSGRDTIFESLFRSSIKSFRPLTYYGSVVNAENLILPATTLANACYQKMFSGCRSLIVAPELPAMTIAPLCYDYMFYKCRSLVTPPDLPATTLAEECYCGMFERCTSLTKSPVLPAESIEVIIDGVDVTKHCYRAMFNGCSSLNEITSLVVRRDDWSTENAGVWTDGVATTGTFYKNPACPSLPVGDSGIPIGWTVKDYEPPTPPFSGKWLATYSNGDTSSAECDSSSAITNGEITKENLVQIEIGDCVTNIGGNAFVNCISLTSVTIPNSVTSIGEYAFYSCYNLASVTIGNSIRTIGEYAFEECSITSVTIPSSVTSIGGSAFNDCWGLTSITINAITPPTLGNNAFNNTDCPIYVPASSIDAYKEASIWSGYADRIQPIA